jgi:protein gp37
VGGLMGDKTKIEWTDSTWGPVTGCTEVSPGCDHCYAKTFAERWRGTPGHYFEQGFDVQLRPDKLNQPLRWKRPRRIFVNSMSDLFHDSVPDEYIAKVFAVMAATHRHTFQLLTKRHGRMRSLLANPRFRALVDQARQGYDWSGSGSDNALFVLPWPLPNVWLGVSVEDQQWADIRIPALLETPAAVRFLSCEPLLGDLDLTPYLWSDPVRHPTGGPVEVVQLARGGLHWVIVGGESGRGARPMHPDWARSLRDQCIAAGVPFLFKQWGAHGVDGFRTSKQAAGRVLDGRTWDEYPEVSDAS